MSALYLLKLFAGYVNIYSKTVNSFNTSHLNDLYIVKNCVRYLRNRLALILPVNL